jgi:hypothetical protein
MASSEALGIITISYFRSNMTFLNIYFNSICIANYIEYNFFFAPNDIYKEYTIIDNCTIEADGYMVANFESFSMQLTNSVLNITNL